MNRLLLHTCCAPCSTAVLERLIEELPETHITVFYYNPNIYPIEEYKKRKNEQIKYIKLLNNPNIDMIDADYDPDKFEKSICGLEHEKEGGKRCSICFLLRLEETAKKAKELNHDFFTTSLTVSPHKNATIINSIGNMLSKKYGIKFLERDFKKKDGFKRSIILSKENNIYRQNYCGCKYSIWQKNMEKEGNHE